MQGFVVNFELSALREVGLGVSPGFGMNFKLWASREVGFGVLPGFVVSVG